MAPPTRPIERQRLALQEYEKAKAAGYVPLGGIVGGKRRGCLAQVTKAMGGAASNVRAMLMQAGVPDVDTTAPGELMRRFLAREAPANAAAAPPTADERAEVMRLKRDLAAARTALERADAAVAQGQD